MNPHPPRLAKLILHYNTQRLTAELCRMVPGAIVVDNGSTSQPYKGENRCIRQDNLGFTAGWNKAIEAVYDEYDAFWLMNSDIRIKPSAVKRIEEVLANSPEVEFFTPAYNCWMKHCQPIRGEGLVEVGVMEFTAPVIRKSVLERIGFFDPLFARGYGVEFDYCYRARKAGIQMYVDHRSEFYHLGQQTICRHEGLLSYSRKGNFELTQGLISKYGDHYQRIVFSGLTIKTDFEMKIAVYTTIFGDYDTLKMIPPQEVKVDYFVVTDNPTIALPGWKTLVVDTPRADLHPRLRAKFWKLFPWEHETLRGYEITIYIDASIRITAPNFIATCIKNLTSDILFFSHPQRNCIYQEGKASEGLKKYKNEPIAQQLAFYRKFHPSNAGLYAGGVIVRRHTDLVKKVMSDWWFENIKYSYQDQLSLPVVLKANGVVPSVFKENQYKNSFMQVEWHDDWDKVQHPPRLMSVLMPVWKTPLALLDRAVESILKQTDPHFELVIVDDNNQDSALLEVLEGYTHDSRIRIVRTKSNAGLAQTLDFGISHCRGELIIRMDSDDIALPGLISAHRKFFDLHPEAAICGVQINMVDPSGVKKGTSRHAEVVDLGLAIENKGYWIVNHPGVCYRKDIVQLVGGYGDTDRKYAEDYALWCKFLLAGYCIYNLPQVLINYTVGDGSQIGQSRKGEEWLAFLEEQKQKLVRAVREKQK